MSMIHHAGGPGRGVTVNEIYQNFFYKGAETLAIGHTVCLDLRAVDGDTVEFSPGGDPANASYPNDHIFRNCIDPTAAHNLSGIFVLVTDLLGNGGAPETEFRGALIAHNVAVVPANSSGDVVIATSQMIGNGGGTDPDQCIVDAVAGGGEKIIAIPHEVITTNGTNSGLMFFNGVEGFGAA